VTASITVPFNWASQEGYAGCVVLKGVRRPEATKRDSKLTPEAYAVLLALVPLIDPFHDLLVMMWECGCRPQEARHMEARHVHLEGHRIEIPALEAKGKKRWRVIYLSPIAEEIVSRLAFLHPSGKIFQNSRGTPWTAWSVNCRFGRLGKTTGTRYAPYDFRHSFATRLLKAGHDPITVSSLLGQKNAAMLCQFYEGISGDGDHLLNAITPPAPPQEPTKDG
jgi:integrase